MLRSLRDHIVEVAIVQKFGIVQCVFCELLFREANPYGMSAIFFGPTGKMGGRQAALECQGLE